MVPTKPISLKISLIDNFFEFSGWHYLKRPYICTPF
jgi:hypothetical protein